MNNLDRVRSMTPSQLKDWFCADRICGECQFGRSSVVCGFTSWLYAEPTADETVATEEPLWADEPLEALHLQPGVLRALLSNGIHTIGALYAIRLYDLKGMEGVGEIRATATAAAFRRHTGEKMRK